MIGDTVTQAHSRGLLEGHGLVLSVWKGGERAQDTVLPHTGASSTVGSDLAALTEDKHHMWLMPYRELKTF